MSALRANPHASGTTAVAVIADELAVAAEADRLAAVGRFEILDTPRDGAFDRIAAMAARLLDAPIVTRTGSGSRPRTAWTASTRSAAIPDCAPPPSSTAPPT